MAVAIPTAVIVGAIAVSALAAAGGAYAAYAASEAQANAINYQRRQTRIQEKQARDAAIAAAEIVHERNQRVLAAQRAALGASGVTTTEGTSLIDQMDAAVEAKLEEERIRVAGETAATGFASQGKLFRWQAGQVRQGGYIGAGTTLLGGVSRAALGYYDYSRGTGAGGTTTTTPTYTGGDYR